MPWFADHNLILVHIPKTGGGSIERYLWGLSSLRRIAENADRSQRCLYSREGAYNGTSLQHQPLRALQDNAVHFGIDFSSPNLRILTIVRNPYDRAVSELFFRGAIQKDSPMDDVHCALLTWITRNQDSHTTPQWTFVADQHGELDKQVDVLRTESLTVDMHKLGYTDYIGPPTSNSWVHLLGSDSIQLINETYSKDFELFGYTKIIPQ